LAEGVFIHVRDNYYLRQRLEAIWSQHFTDVPRPNKVHIRFGRKARRRMGSITSSKDNNFQKNHDTHIAINGHFRNEEVPEYVIDATIIHELCHYAHGFSSPLPRVCPHPHKGGVVETEMDKRGIAHFAEREVGWLRRNWHAFLRPTGSCPEEQLDEIVHTGA